jgi:hypothetical protein
MTEPIRQSVRSMLSVLAGGIGIGTKATFGWDRSGASTLNLLAAGDWTTRDIYGDIGQFALKFPSTLVSDCNLQYRVIGDDVKTALNTTWLGLAPKLAPKHPQAASAVGSQQVGSIGLTAIVNLLPVIWSLLNPRVTLQMPGQIELSLVMESANRLVVEFVTPVSVEIVWGIRWHSAPRRMSVTDAAVKAEYVIGLFSREKTWEF